TCVCHGSCAELKSNFLSDLKILSTGVNLLVQLFHNHIIHVCRIKRHTRVRRYHLPGREVQEVRGSLEGDTGRDHITRSGERVRREEGRKWSRGNDERRG
ncbi:unnamed protein product, partial [Pylaiella littoralis]